MGEGGAEHSPLEHFFLRADSRVAAGKWEKWGLRIQQKIKLQAKKTSFFFLFKSMGSLFQTMQQLIFIEGLQCAIDYLHNTSVWQVLTIFSIL